MNASRSGRRALHASTGFQNERPRVIQNPRHRRVGAALGRFLALRDVPLGVADQDP